MHEEEPRILLYKNFQAYVINKVGEIYNAFTEIMGEKIEFSAISYEALEKHFHMIVNDNYRQSFRAMEAKHIPLDETEEEDQQLIPDAIIKAATIRCIMAYSEMPSIHSEELHLKVTETILEILKDFLNK